MKQVVLNGSLVATAAAGLFACASGGGGPASAPASQPAASGEAAMTKAEESVELVKCAGINECRGTGACAGQGHDCAGQNECKGQGWVKVAIQACEAEGGTVI